MTKDQAMKALPELFHKMGGAYGMSIDAVSTARAYTDFLYRHQFVVLSRKEREPKDKAE